MCVFRISKYIYEFTLYIYIFYIVKLCNILYGKKPQKTYSLLFQRVTVGTQIIVPIRSVHPNRPPTTGKRNML